MAVTERGLPLIPEADVEEGAKCHQAVTVLHEW